ncbi:MAG: DegV family protein [Bacillota bacterium]
MTEVAIVTDSTADLPAALARDLRITVVPLKVIFGQKVYRDGVDIDSNTFYARLKAGETATTSQPSPGEFEAAYRKLLEDGKSIISMHISRDLSGTVNSAETARSFFPDARITVIDSRLVAAGLGLVAQAAARAALEGRALDDIVSLTRRIMQTTRIFFCVETLEYLRRGGRIGKAQALLGTILNINPILTVHEGIIQPFEKVRGRRVALRRLAEIAIQKAGNHPMICAVLQGANPEAAEILTSLLKDLPPGSTVDQGTVGPVVGAHAGPGVYGITFYRI